jgi:hypothetical protein
MQLVNGCGAPGQRYHYDPRVEQTCVEEYHSLSAVMVMAKIMAGKIWGSLPRQKRSGGCQSYTN